MAADAAGRYQVVRDTRDKEGHGWTFAPGTRCAGTVVRKLDTGDYSLAGLEHRFCIERKGSVSEFAQNLFQARFERELVRLDAFAHAYLFLEFDAKALSLFPDGSDVPWAKRKRLRVRGPQALKAFHEMQMRHPSLRVLFVGDQGKAVADSLFKRVWEADRGLAVAAG